MICRIWYKIQKWLYRLREHADTWCSISCKFSCESMAARFYLEKRTLHAGKISKSLSATLQKMKTSALWQCTSWEPPTNIRGFWPLRCQSYYLHWTQLIKYCGQNISVDALFVLPLYAKRSHVLPHRRIPLLKAIARTGSGIHEWKQFKTLVAHDVPTVGNQPPTTPKKMFDRLQAEVLSMFTIFRKGSGDSNLFYIS